MIRRNIRLRKEYLYKKSQEAKEREKQDRRVRVKNALDNDRKIPNEYRKNGEEAIKDLELADDHTIARRTTIDDEYEEAKYRDPKLLITTSRDPSQRLIQFQKEMKIILPESIRVNRGGYVLKAISTLGDWLGHLQTRAPRVSAWI